MELNYRGLGEILLIAAFCIAILCLVPGAHAADANATVAGGNVSLLDIANQTSGYAIVDYEDIFDTVKEVVLNSTAKNDTAPAERIQQGQCVEIGKYYDIGGVGWWSGYIEWYGRYNDDFSPTNLTRKAIKEIPSSPAALSRFYIDPEYFSNKTGYWFVTDDRIRMERAANNRLFYVSNVCLQNASFANATQNESAENTTIGIQSGLPPKYEGGNIILARGDNLAIPESNFSGFRVWIFGGMTDKMYDRNVDGMLMSKDGFASEMVGHYDALLVSSGNNSIYEELYDNKTLEVVSKFIDGERMPINSALPVESFLKTRAYIERTIDDSAIQYGIEFQEPSISVARFESIPLGENGTLYRVRGYTNMANGTAIRVLIDNNPNMKTETTATGVNLNEYRQFVADVLVVNSEFSPGDHDIIVVAENGMRVSVPFYIRKELADHFKPPEYITFVDNSPFIPPTIVEKEVVKEKIVEVVKTEVVVEKLDYTKLASEDIRILSPIVVILAILFVLAAYTGRMLARTVDRRERRKEEETEENK